MDYGSKGAPYGVILAGGRSRRFGIDKCSFEYRGQPLIQHVRDALAKVVSTILISGSEALAESYDSRDQVIIDRIADRGPVHALLTVIDHIKSSHFVVVPCDMPHLRAESLRLIVSQAMKPGVLACTAIDSDLRVNPLCACYSVESEPYLREVAARNNPAARDLIAAMPSVKTVQLPDHELVNINRPEDIPE